MEVIELFKHFIRAKSETPDDGGLLGFIAEYLSDFHAIGLDRNGVKNLFLYKKFSEGEHLCFAGHVDVVPAGDGWSTNPYDAVEKDGYIYGRGTQDMKSGVAAFVQATKETQHFGGTLSLLLTSDEEGEGRDGTKIVLEYLKEHNMLPDSAIVAEPTCEAYFGDAIKVGRRGSINGYLTLKGKQGHAAYPEKAINPIHQIAPILSKIAGINVRNSTKTTQEDIEAFIAKHFDGLDYDLQLTQGSYPFMTNTESKVVQNISKAIQSVTKRTPQHSTAGGTSDARYLAPMGIEVIEFGVKNDTIHSVNERTTRAEVEGLYEVFKRFIQNWK